MKTVCHREGMLTACQIAASVIPARSPKAILRNVRFDVAEDHQATLLATDLEQGIHYRVSGVHCEEPGRALLPTHEFLAILRELPDETFQLTTTASGIQIAGGSSRFDLPGEDPAGFPELPEIEASIGLKIPAATLATMIRRTSFAAANENSRFALASVMMEFDADGSGRFIATDSKRLALMPGKATRVGDAAAVGASSALAPPKALSLVQKILQDPEEEVLVSIGANEAVFKTAKVTIYTRLVEGRFPPYQTVIPKDHKVKVPLQVERFMAAVRQAKIVTSAESKGVRFSFEEGVVVLKSQGADVGESEVRLPITYDYEPLEITFDPELLVDALKVLDPTEEVVLQMTDSRRASVFRTGDDYYYVVMPLTRDSK